MDAFQPHRAPLLEGARTFLVEAVRLKRAVSAAAARNATAGPMDFEPLTTPGAEVEEDLSFDGVRRRLLVSMERQAQLMGHRHEDHESRRFEEVRYVLAATADELFVHTAWPGQDAWRAALLEEELFGTHDAGDRFFRNAEQLLRERDPGRADVAAVHQLAIALGFQGKYRDLPGGAAALDDLRRQLFGFVFRREPDLPHPSRFLTPEARAHTHDEMNDRRLARAWPWLAAIGAAAFLYVAIGAALWSSETKGLSQSLRIIHEHGALSP